MWGEWTRIVNKNAFKKQKGVTVVDPPCRPIRRLKCGQCSAYCDSMWSFTRWSRRAIVHCSTSDCCHRLQFWASRLASSRMIIFSHSHTFKPSAVKRISRTAVTTNRVTLGLCAPTTPPLVTVYTVSQKHPRHYRLKLEDFNIFGTNIPDLISHQTTVQFSISFNCCFCST